LIFKNAENIHLRSQTAKIIIIFLFCSYVSFAQNQSSVLRQGKISIVKDLGEKELFEYHEGRSAANR
jgi:hypothetical protein